MQLIKYIMYNTQFFKVAISMIPCI